METLTFTLTEADFKVRQIKPPAKNRTEKIRRLERILCLPKRDLSKRDPDEYLRRLFFEWGSRPPTQLDVLAQLPKFRNPVEVAAERIDRCIHNHRVMIIDGRVYQMPAPLIELHSKWESGLYRRHVWDQLKAKAFPLEYQLQSIREEYHAEMV